MKKLFPFLFSIYITTNLFAQVDVSSLIKQGLSYSYNFQLEKAEEIFDKIISKNPNDPSGYHYKSSIYLWTYLSNKEKDDFEKFIIYSDLAVDRGLKILDQKGDDENALYILGANYGFRAMAFMKSNSYINAVWSIRNSNKYLKETLENNPNNYDAYLGLGLFNYALSLVPGVFKWALKMAGLSGNRDQGINYLKYAYRNGNYTKIESAYYLSQIYSETFIDYNAAIGYLKQIIKENPSNLLFQYSYAVVLIKNRRPIEAEKILRQIIKSNNPYFKQITSFSNFLLGDIYFRRNEFDSAINYYEKFISTTKEIDYTGIAYYRIALCYENLGKREEGKRYFIFAGNGNLDIQDDVYAKRKSEIYLNRTLSSNEMNILRFSNMIESGYFQSAYDSLLSILPKINSEKLNAEANLYLSDVCFEIGKYEESIEYGIKASTFNLTNEIWIKPFAYFFVARTYFKLGNKQETINYLEKAEDINDYDYQTKLTAFINTLKAKVAPLQQ